MSSIAISEAAKILKVSVKTLQRWDDDNTLPAIREEVSNTRVYDEELVRGYKEYLFARAKEKNHLNKLGPIRQNIEKFLVTKPLAPGESPQVLDGLELESAYKALDQWNEMEREFREETAKFTPLLIKLDSIRKAKQRNEKT